MVARVGAAVLITVTCLVGASASHALGVSYTYRNVACDNEVVGQHLTSRADIAVSFSLPNSVAPGRSFTMTFPGRTFTIPTNANGLALQSYELHAFTYQLTGATFSTAPVIAGGATLHPTAGGPTRRADFRASVLDGDLLELATVGPVPPGQLTTPTVTVTATASATKPPAVKPLALAVHARYAPFVAHVVCRFPGTTLATVPTHVAALRMVALGDSYSAGVGVGAVGSGCDRDRLAYAPRARNDLLPSSYRIDSFTHPACSGAKTSDLLVKQLPTVASTDTVASVTIGGNDIGFGPKIMGCAIGGCGPDTYGLQADVRGGSQTWDGLFDKLVTTYVNIRKRMATNGHLYVLTYPIPFSRDLTNACNGFNATEQNAANALVTRLGDTIYLATKRAAELLRSKHGRPGNVRFVEWRTGTRIDKGYTIPAGQPGAGQKYATYKSADGLCNTRGRNPFINGYVGALPAGIANPLGNSFHPKSKGYWKAATLLYAAIRTHQP